MALLSAEDAITLAQDQMRRDGVPETVPWRSTAAMKDRGWSRPDDPVAWVVRTWVASPPPPARPPGIPDYFHDVVEDVNGAHRVTQAIPRP